MDYFKYILLFCLILFPITSKSYALTNSWCSNGKYDRAISPFPKRNFNKCPAYAKVIMTKKEVKDYYLNGLGKEYLCKITKNPLFFVNSKHKREDYEALKLLFKPNQVDVGLMCAQLNRIKWTKTKEKNVKSNLKLEPKEWCISANKFGTQYPTKKLKECPQTSYEITSKEAEKIFLSGSGSKYLANIIETGAICKNDKSQYKFIRELLKSKKDLGCDKQKTLAEKKAEEEARIRALAEKLAKEEIARQLRLKQKEEEDAKQEALAKKKAEELAEQKALAEKKAKEEARKKALARKKAKEDAARKKAIEAKKAEEKALKQKNLNEKIAKTKDEAQFIVETLKEYVTTDNNKLDILEISELLENFDNEKQKGWSDATIEKYEALYDYVQKDDGFVTYSSEKKSKQLAAYNEEIIQLREYLTMSQSDLKAFITKNLGSNNAKKALKLAKETKQVLKDFDVTKAMSLKNDISTWKAMNGVAENKKYTFKILNKKTETKKQSVTKQVTQNKPSVTKSLRKVPANVRTSKDYKIGDYPEFLKDKFWYANKDYRENKSCNYIKDQQKISSFTHYSKNKVSVLIRFTDKSLGKSMDYINSGKVEIIKTKPKILIKADYGFKSSIKSKWRGKWCRNEKTLVYDPKSEELTSVGCFKTNCSTGLFDPCEKQVMYSCSGYPTK